MANDITSDTTNRFSILVPKPKARINLGKPDPGGEEAFGYSGMSLQSSVHLFIDVNKVTLFQSGSNACFQAGGKWLQWSDGPMFSASEANHTVAAGRKMLVVAGAGQGRDMALPAGLEHVTPRVVEYNNLELHYVVEEIHNGLKNFFYGEDDKWQDAEKKTQATQDPAAGKKADYPDDSFLKEYAELLEELGYDDAARAALCQPLEWEGDYLDTRFKPSSVYGAFRAFDPYPAAPFAGPISKVYAGFVQVVNAMHRFVDVLKAIGPGLTNSPVGKPVVNLINAWGNAQEGLNSALNVADFARYDRSTGKTADGWAWHDELGEMRHRLPESPEEEPAEMSSLSAPFDISKVSPPIMKVRDVESGAQTSIDFSEFLEGEKAVATITPSTSLWKISVDAAGDGAVVLDGANVSYTEESDSWAALPAGFVWDPADAHEAIKKSDGSAFSASKSGEVEIEDESFEAGEVLPLVIDDVAYEVELEGVKRDLSDASSTRADALAAAINAKHGGAATAAGGVVTIESDKVGASANVKAFPEAAVMTKLGMSGAISEVGSGAGLVTADELKEMLEGKGTYEAEVSGSTVKIEHTTKGTSSYLQFAEGPAAVFFGSDPAVARGKPDPAKTDFFSQFSAARSLQYEIAKWPEDVRNLMRPVYEAFGDVSAVVDRIKGVIDSLTMLGDGGPPKMLGLLAKDGVSLGTAGSLYQAAKVVTIVAAPGGEPDERKFVPLIEKPIHWLLEFDLGKLVAAKMKPKPKKMHGKDGAGDVRILAHKNITMAAKSTLRATSLGMAHVEGASLALRSKGQTTIAAREGGIWIRAKSMTIGDLEEDKAHKQAETKRITMQAADAVTVLNEHVRLAFDKKVIALGTSAANSLEVDVKKPHLHVDDAKISVGFVDGGKEFGVSTAKNGDVTALAKSKFMIGAGTAGVTVGSGEVAVAGKLKVGSALLVNGDGMFTAPAVTALAQAQTRIPQIKVEYAQIIVTATGQQAILTGLKKTRDTLLPVAENLLNPIASAAARKALMKISYKISQARFKLGLTETKWKALVAEAKSFEMTDGDLGRKPADDDLFLH